MELQDKVGLRVFLLISCPLKYWMAVAVPFAVFPLFDEDLLLIAQSVVLDLAVTDAEVHVAEPFP